MAADKTPRTKSGLSVRQLRRLARVAIKMIDDPGTSPAQKMELFQQIHRFEKMFSQLMAEPDPEEQHVGVPVPKSLQS